MGAPGPRRTGGMTARGVTRHVPPRGAQLRHCSASSVTVTRSSRVPPALGRRQLRRQAWHSPGEGLDPEHGCAPAHPQRGASGPGRGAGAGRQGQPRTEGGRLGQVCVSPSKGVSLQPQNSRPWSSRRGNGAEEGLSHLSTVRARAGCSWLRLKTAKPQTAWERWVGVTMKAAGLCPAGGNRLLPTVSECAYVQSP